MTFKIIESRRTGDKTATDVNLVEEEKTVVDSEQLLRGTAILKKGNIEFNMNPTYCHYQIHMASLKVKITVEKHFFTIPNCHANQKK